MKKTCREINRHGWTRQAERGNDSGPAGHGNDTAALL